MSMSNANEADVGQARQSRSRGSLSVAVSPDSPFADGYDIASERDALADLVAAENPDASDPRWSRFLVLREREEELSRAKTKEPLRRGRAISAAQQVARSAAEVGRLIDEEPDTMTLHTREGFRLFTGRQLTPEGRAIHIAGGQRFAAVLKSIWFLSGNDNPYADWLLIAMHDRLSKLRWEIECITAEKQQSIEVLKTRGLSFSVLRSKNPKTVELGFRSPYGYATASLIVVFDYYVRMVKTLVRKDRLSDAEGWNAVHKAEGDIRALFLEPIRWERFLIRDEMMALCRADFLPGMDESCKKRVKAAVALFGEVPRPVFTGAVLPRHAKRHIKRTEAELRLLRQVPLSAVDEKDADETELL